MEGSGVTNYDVDKPSYAYTTSTTQFDDELIRRGIVTQSQVLLAKGASETETSRLVDLATTPAVPNVTEDQNIHGDDYSFEDSDDDRFMECYRKERLATMQRAHQERKQGLWFDEPRPIGRSEWKSEVNDASYNVWVVVCLTSSDTERTGLIESCVRDLSQSMNSTKFVLIPCHQAIENWPTENLPSLFLYRHGKMTKQLLRLDSFATAEGLRELLDPLLVDDDE